MRRPRWVHAIVMVSVMLLVAAFFIWQGILFIVHGGAGIPAWLGWFLLAAGLLKGALWVFVAVVLFRHRHALFE